MRALASIRLILLCALVPVTASAEPHTVLPNTSPLDMHGDMAMHMLDGMHDYLDALLDKRENDRIWHWQDLFKSDNNDAALNEKRKHLRSILGAVDKRVPVRMETLAEPGAEGPIAHGAAFKVYAVQWAVLPGVYGEGYLLEPDGEVVASLIVLPDADERPEDYVGLSQEGPDFPQRFAAAGYRVLVMDLIDRDSSYAGHPDVRMTQQSHREFIYRSAFEMGRHIIGYEILKIESAIDWLKEKAPQKKLGLYGYAEGGMLALYTTALNTRIDAVHVAGHFGPREELWKEPIYRNVWSLLNTFGDAELAAMIAPRHLVIQEAPLPKVKTPPYSNDKSHGVAPGQFVQSNRAELVMLMELARSYVHEKHPDPWMHLTALDKYSLQEFSHFVGPVPSSKAGKLMIKPDFALANEARMERQVSQLLDWTQKRVEASPDIRAALWKKADGQSLQNWIESTKVLREHFHKEVMGALPEEEVPLHPRTRLIFETEAYTGYEVVLDVNANVIAYGYLLVPKGIPQGERRPVVVCQHGLEGRPDDVAHPDKLNTHYEQYGCKLAEEGFIVYAPQNPYIHHDRFRTIQRKANPLGLSLFSFIIAQHQATLDWLKTLPYVDADRIAFYGLSYGGKTAMRVPAVLQEYCLSICSADFNEWIWKNTSIRSKYSYVYTGEYEIFEWNLGNTYNYAEMSWLICPRPFMVERGHDDGVAPDTWVAYEYARTRERYVRLGLGEETEIEFFNGPHKIHGVGTFAFLREKLNYPGARGDGNE